MTKSAGVHWGAMYGGQAGWAVGVHRFSLVVWGRDQPQWIVGKNIFVARHMCVVGGLGNSREWSLFTWLTAEDEP